MHGIVSETWRAAGGKLASLAKIFLLKKKHLTPNPEAEAWVAVTESPMLCTATLLQPPIICALGTAMGLEGIAADSIEER
ncbi:hypothetical protein G5S34_15210 [Herbaspirillum frisingense]|uniref:hypothetical protein n=1 Tax=Herbaspirillum frisingense TaxID=92645 RepID=UPI001601B0E5|nr:hypothetical protein [Herbaspirillum frisingense]QNB07973.1 hypothetical protein G5S34_15210 [Herbaspirillum frisingense]